MPRLVSELRLFDGGGRVPGERLQHIEIGGPEGGGAGAVHIKDAERPALRGERRACERAAPRALTLRDVRSLPGYIGRENGNALLDDAPDHHPADARAGDRRPVARPRHARRELAGRFVEEQRYARSAGSVSKATWISFANSPRNVEPPST